MLRLPVTLSFYIFIYCDELKFFSEDSCSRSLSWKTAIPAPLCYFLFFVLFDTFSVLYFRRRMEDWYFMNYRALKENPGSYLFLSTKGRLGMSCSSWTMQCCSSFVCLLLACFSVKRKILLTCWKEKSWLSVRETICGEKRADLVTVLHCVGQVLGSLR